MSVNCVKGAANFAKDVLQGIRKMPLALPEGKPLKPIAQGIDTAAMYVEEVPVMDGSRMTMYLKERGAKYYSAACSEIYLPERKIINRFYDDDNVLTIVEKGKNYLKIMRSNDALYEQRTYEEILNKSGQKIKVSSYRTSLFRVGAPSPATVNRKHNFVSKYPYAGPVEVNIVETISPDGSRVLKEEYVVPSTGIHNWLDKNGNDSLAAKHFFIKDVKLTRETEITKGFEEAQSQPFKVEFLKFYDVQAPEDMVNSAPNKESLAAEVFNKIFSGKEWNGKTAWERLQDTFYGTKLQEILT